MDEPKADTGNSSSEEGVMEGKGFYSSHSQPQHDAMAFGLPLITRAAKEIPLPGPNQVCVIADYGVAGGRNSIEPMRTAIALLRQRANLPFPITVVHTDIPTNDFDPLFQLLASPGSYLVNTENVFAYVAGKSFYEQLFPDDRVALGWNAIAVHWLSSVPATISNHIWSNFATGAVKEKFAARGRADWVTFLECRARELVEGGRLVVLGGASDGQDKTGAEGLMNMANESLQELTRQGALKADEYARMVIPTYNRTLAEFQAPFLPGARMGDLELEHASLVALDDPFWDAYQQDGDAARYANAYAGFFEAAYGPSLFGVLDSDRNPTVKQQIADAFYAKLRAKITANPAAAATRWRVALLLIGKNTAG